MTLYRIIKRIKQTKVELCACKKLEKFIVKLINEASFGVFLALVKIRLSFLLSQFFRCYN